MFNERIKTHHMSHPKRAIPATMDEFEDFLQNNQSSDDGVIYFHIPFCDNICSFCSMNRSKLNDELEVYTKFLLAEIEKYAKFEYFKHKNIKSIYFGGGTPTILKQSQLELILQALHKNFKVSEGCEISLESTLHNLSISKLKSLKNLGVNRFSIGIQTFNDEGRKLLNRVGGKDEAIGKLSNIRDEFSKFVCIDIIYNYPNQSVEDVLENAKIADQIGVDSVSFYSLMFHEGSALSNEISPSYYNLQTDKALHHAFVNSMLESKNYEILEHTKLVKKGRDEYKYIRLSHSGADVLPIGVGAAGKVGDFGLFNMKKDMVMMGILDEREQNFNKFINLFQYPSVKFDKISQFISQNGLSELKNFFKECEKNGLLSLDDEGINLSLDGVFWGNTIANEIGKKLRKEFE